MPPSPGPGRDDANTGNQVGVFFSSGGIEGGGSGNGVAGSVASGGSPVSSGSSGSHSVAGSPGGYTRDEGGCAIVAVNSTPKQGYGAVALGLALLAFRRRRSAQR